MAHLLQLLRSAEQHNRLIAVIVAVHICGLSGGQHASEIHTGDGHLQDALECLELHGLNAGVL